MADAPGWFEAEAKHTDDVIGTDTLGEAFAASATRHPDLDAQRYKGGVYDRALTDAIVPAAPDDGYRAISYERMHELVQSLAAGFRAVGVRADDRVGIFASTRMEWALADYALLSAGAVVTTVYTDSSPEQVRYLLSDPGASALVVGTEDQLQRVLSVEDELDLSTIVVLDEYDTDRDDIVTLADVYDRGEAAFDASTYRSWLDARTAEDLATIVYTSGTTGKPKGVRITHGNVRANINQVRRRLGPRPDRDPETPVIDSGTNTIAFLPLAHIFERTCGHFCMFTSGATVGYAENPDTLAEDFRTLEPDFAASVPRVYERILANARRQASASAAKERIFEWATDVAKRYARTDAPGPSLRAQHALADRLVYSTVREGLGGNIKFLVSGGGSLSAALSATFLGMGIDIVEGYGLTETSPVVTIDVVEDLRPGTLGYPVTELETRLDTGVVDGMEFPEADGPVGELLVAGPNVADGYWKDPGATGRAFIERDGKRWFRTGDIIERTDDDFLVYHDRLKQLLVLSTGKNVAPQPIEDLFSTDDRIEQVMVVGDGRKFVGALVVPNVAEIARLAEKHGVDLPEDPEEWCDDERVRAWIQEAIDAGNERLERIERIKAFELVTREWTVDNDLLTPSMKKKRHNIHEEFRPKVETLYE